MAIEKLFPSNPDAVIYTTVNFMQFWEDVLKKDDKVKLLLKIAC